ncbi:MAG: hypothetical protein NZ518_11580, partial [Dehalococcoidia bacterium]|nr:hypothetical protein [Dehalococcoidia bacterium]
MKTQLSMDQFPTRDAAMQRSGASPLHMDDQGFANPSLDPDLVREVLDTAGFDVRGRAADTFDYDDHGDPILRNADTLDIVDDDDANDTQGAE